VFERENFERERLERIIERLVRIVDELLAKRGGIAVSAKGQIMPAKIAVGGKGATFTFTEFDGPNGTGNVVPPSGPITYASDTPGVATVDQTGQVTAVAPGSTVISGIDPASPNKVAAADVLTVSPVQGVAVSATGVLS